MNIDSRFVKVRLTVFVMLPLLLLSGCKGEENDTIEFRQSRRWVEKTIALVAPTSADAATKARFERTAAWLYHCWNPQWPIWLLTEPYKSRPF